MEIGVAYYPEHVSDTQRVIDMDRIKEIGFNAIRVGDFAWSSMEPSPGQYTLDWLDQTFELARTREIRVLLCTPTAAPPQWLVNSDPELLPVDRNGRRLRFGARQHRCYNNPTYFRHSMKIAEALSERYGTHDALLGWQIDNEMGGEVKRCYCEICRQNFVSYLRIEYHTIDELNQRWGTMFWSGEYLGWDSIKLPQAHAGDLLMKHHPSLELAFRKFSSDSIVRFAHAQADILRKGSKPDAVVTTNADPFVWGDNVHLRELFAKLDVAAIDLYTEDMTEIAFYSDFFRGIKDDGFWMTEYPPRSPALDQELSILSNHGCERLFFFKYRPFPWGQEQGGRSVLSMTDQAGPQFPVIARWAKSPRETSAARAEVGLFYSFHSSWTYDLESWSFDDWEVRSIYPKRMIYQVSAGLYAADILVKVLYKDSSLVGLRIIVAPWLIIHDSEIEAALLSWVKAGGILISTTDLFRKNHDNVYLTNVPAFYREVFGDECSDFLYEEDYKGQLVAAEMTYGSGEVILIGDTADSGCWSTVAQSRLR